MEQIAQSPASRCLEAHAENSYNTFERAQFKAGELISRALVRRRVANVRSSRAMQVASTLHSPLRSPNNADTVPLAGLLPPSRAVPNRPTFHALQEWEGHVVDIGEDEFTARLVDLTAGLTYESLEAIIPMAEISGRDASRMVVGSIFRWVIGYERSPEGTRKRVSQIVFRDLPRVTSTDLRRGEEWADKIAPALGL